LHSSDFRQTPLVLEQKELTLAAVVLQLQVVLAVEVVEVLLPV
jgi:hypothetical protein